MNSLRLRNPHSILAVLSARPSDVLQVNVPAAYLRPSAGAPADAWTRVVQLALEKKIPVSQSGGGEPRAPGRGERGRGPGGRPSHGDVGPEGPGRQSPMEALVRERTGLSVEELFRGARERGGGKGLWLALDSLQDPQNVGSIFRIAGFFGVQGILLTQERSAPLTGTVYDVACGGVESVPFTLQTNLQRGFEAAKDNGLWILGSSEHAKQPISKVEADRPWLLVLGNEEKGMRRLTAEACDVLCTIPCSGGVTSLNVSAAAAVLISHFSMA